jgi:RNA polymerase-binding transcription factor DksA
MKQWTRSIAGGLGACERSARSIFSLARLRVVPAARPCIACERTGERAVSA